MHFTFKLKTMANNLIFFFMIAQIATMVIAITIFIIKSFPNRKTIDLNDQTTFTILSSNI